MQNVSPTVPTSPPSSFLSPVRKARKRSSDEFVLDQSGILSKLALNGPADLADDQHPDVTLQQKRQSAALVPSSNASPARDRRRGGSVRLSMVTVPKSSLIQTKSGSIRHSRQQSAGSVGESLRHRPTTSDASIPSPSSASQIRRTSGPSIRTSSEKLSFSREQNFHSSPSVAHSLLRGTQEGWSALDDDATAEALRKLDGISGKGPRSRGSIRAASRSSNNSRPGTPASRGHRSEGTEGSDRLSRINSVGSHRIREKHLSEAAVASDKDAHESDREHPKPISGEPPLVNSDASPLTGATLDIESKKHLSGVRLSYTQKRGSASSTNFTGTPTSASRESTNLSTSTSVTSVSTGSQRFSLIKMRRNSAGSDISSIHSEVSSHRDRTSYLSEAGDGSSVPPVPPLPKDLSSFKTPPQSSTSLVFPALETALDASKEHNGDTSGTGHPNEDTGQLRASESSAAKAEPNSTGPREAGVTVQHPITKTPSKKWSFTNPLNIRHSGSPARQDSSNTKHSGGQARSSKLEKRLRPSSSKESTLLPAISPKSSVEAWQNIQKVAMASETSLASLSSMSSLPEPSPPVSPAHPAGLVPAQRNNQSPSRPATGSSHSAATTPFLDTQVCQDSPTSKASSRDAANKRLTPSSIPFFRRTSSHSVQTSSTRTGVSGSPTSSSVPNVRQSMLKVNEARTKERPPTSPTTPGSSQRKSSMLTLGLPSILKGSSSRKSLQVDRNPNLPREANKIRRHKDSEGEQAKVRKDEKDRSESRISVLMGRKRGKVCGSVMTV